MAPGALTGTRDDVNKSVEVWWGRMGSFRSGTVLAVSDTLEPAQHRLEVASAHKERAAAELAGATAERPLADEAASAAASGLNTRPQAADTVAAEYARSVADHEAASAAVDELSKLPLGQRVTVTIEYADTRERCHHPLRELEAIGIRIAFDLAVFVPEQPKPGAYSSGRIVEDPELEPVPEDSRDFVPLPSRRTQVAALRKSISGLLGAHPRDYHVAIARLGESRVDLVNEAALCGALHAVMWRLASGTAQADPSCTDEWATGPASPSTTSRHPAAAGAAGRSADSPAAGAEPAPAEGADGSLPRDPVPLWFICAAMDLFAGLAGTARPLVVHRLGAAIAAAATCAASSPKSPAAVDPAVRLMQAADAIDEAALRAPRLRRSDAAAWRERAELELWGQLLRAHQLDKKVLALDRIKAGVAIVADSPQNSSGGLQAPEMAEWLCDRHVLSAIFGASSSPDATPAQAAAGAALATGDASATAPRASSGGSAHSEVVQRAGPILAFLAEHSRITPSDLRVAWHAAAGRHAATERSILVTLVNLTSSLSPAMRQELAGVISATPFSAWTERVVATVRDFTLEAAFAEMAEATQPQDGASTPPRRPSRLPNGADLLWQFVQDRGGAATHQPRASDGASPASSADAFDPAQGCRPPTERLFLAAVDAFVELLARLRTGAAAQLAAAEEDHANASRHDAEAAAARVKTLEAFAKQAEDLTGHFVDRCLLCISGSAGSAGQSVIILRRVLASLPRAAKPKGWLRGKEKPFGRTLDSELLRLDAVPRSRTSQAGGGSLLALLLDELLHYSAAIRSVASHNAEPEGKTRAHTGLGSFGEAVFRLTPVGFRTFAQLLTLVAAQDGNVSVKPVRQPPQGFKWKPSLDSMAGGAAAAQAKAAAEADEAIARAALQDPRDAERVVIGGMVVALDPAENAWACGARQAWSSTFGASSGSSSVLARPRAPPASRPVTGAMKRQAPVDFPGIDALWVLAVHAADATVGRAATSMLVTLHTALSQSTVGKGAALRRGFVVKALRYVESAVELRRGVLEGTYSASAVPAPRHSSANSGGGGALGASSSQADSKSGVVPPTPPLGAMRAAPRRHKSQGTKAEPGAPTPEPDAEALAWQEGELARQRAMHRWSVSSLPGVVRAVAAMRELLQGVIGQDTDLRGAAATSGKGSARAATSAAAAGAEAGGGGASKTGGAAATSGSDWADVLTDLSGRDTAAELGEPVGTRRVIVVCDPLPPAVLGSAPGKGRHWSCQLTAKLTPAMLIRRVARFSGWAPESIVLRLESDGPSAAPGRLLFSMVTPLVEEAGRSTEDVQITALHKRGMGAGDVRIAGSSLEGSVGAGEAELERWGLHARPGSSAREDGWWREPDSTLASPPLRADPRALSPSALDSGLFGRPRRAVDLAGGLEPPDADPSPDSEHLSAAAAPELACGALVSARPRLAHDFDPWSNPWAVGADLPPAKADAAMLALVPHAANSTQLSRGNVPPTQLGLSVQGLNLVGSDARAFEQLSSMSLVEGGLARQAFAQLFALLSMAPAGIRASPTSRPSDSDAIEWAAAAAWETIQLLPTNPQTLQAIRLANRDGAPQKWEELLHPLTTGRGTTALDEGSLADEEATSLSGRGEAASRDFTAPPALPASPPSLFGLLYTLQAVDVFVHGAKPAGMTQTQFDRRIRSQMCDGVPQGTLIRFNFCSDMVRLGGARALEQLALRTKFSGPAGPACAAVVLRILHTLLSLDPSFSPVDIVPSTADEAADDRASAGAAGGGSLGGTDVWEQLPVPGPLGTGGMAGAARALGRPRAAWAMRSVTNYMPGQVLRRVNLPGLCTAVIEQMLHRGRQRAADRRAWSVGGARGPIPGSAHSGWSGCGTAIQGMQLLVSCVATDPAACIPAILGHRALTPWLRHFCLNAASPERFAVCQGLLRISSFLPAVLSFPGLKAAAAGAGIAVPGPAAVLLGMLVPMLPSADTAHSRSVQRRSGHLYSLVAGLAADVSKTEVAAAMADIPAVAQTEGCDPLAAPATPTRSRGSGPHVRERVSHSSASSPVSDGEEADELTARAAARCIEAALTFKGLGWLFRRLVGQILSTSSHESAHAGEIGADHCLRGAMRAARIVARVAPLVRRTPLVARAIPFLVHTVLFPAPSAAEELPPVQPLPDAPATAEKGGDGTPDDVAAPSSASGSPVERGNDAALASKEGPDDDQDKADLGAPLEKQASAGLATPPRHGATASVSGPSAAATPGLPFALDDCSVNGDAMEDAEEEEEDAAWEQAASASARFGPLAVTPGTRSVAYALLLELAAPDPELEPLECDDADNMDSWLPPALVAEDPSALLTAGWSRPPRRLAVAAAAASDAMAYVSGAPRPRLPVLAAVAPAPGPLATLRPAPALGQEAADMARAIAASAAEAGALAVAPARATASSALDRFELGGLGPADRSRLLLQCMDDAWRSGGVVMGVGDGETGDTVQAERWLVDPTQVQRSGRPFVGLQNLGATCYMNSTLQQLFCAPTFREALLHAPLPEPGRQHAEVLQSLQELIGFLALSQRRWADTAAFASAFKELDGSPLRRGEHKDALEFLTLLFDRLEAASPAMGDVVKRTFGGTVASQIISLETPYVSQREDPFTLLSLEVEGHGSIQRALEAFGEGEILSGDNRYRLPDGRSVEAKKRSLPRDLPPRLMLHLNRLKFDLATLSRKKVNDYVAFPPRLDMRPYCLEGVQERERAEGVAVGPESADGDASAGVPARPPWYYQYELTGVVLHVGSADAGHYFSFVKGSRLSGCEGRPASRAPQASGGSAAPSAAGATDASTSAAPTTASEFGDDWWELNDRLVRPIDPTRIPELCFGGFEDDAAAAAPAAGATGTHSHASSAAAAEAALPKSQRQRILNAYILIYERVAPPEPDASRGVGSNPLEPRTGAADAAALARAASADTAGEQSHVSGRSRGESLAGWLGASLGPEDTPHLAALPTPALVSGGMGPLGGARGRPMSKTSALGAAPGGGGEAGGGAAHGGADRAAGSSPHSDGGCAAEETDEDPRSAMRELDLGSPAMGHAKPVAGDGSGEGGRGGGTGDGAGGAACGGGLGGGEPTQPPLLRATSQGTRPRRQLPDHVTQAVWAASREFVITSLTFSPDFTAFVWALASLPSELQKAAHARAESIRRHEAKRLHGAAASVAAKLERWVTPPDVRAGALAVGFRGWLDVVSRASPQLARKMGARAWLPALRLATDASPTAARSLVSRLALDAAMRRRAVLHCPHAHQRKSAAGLMLRAFRAGADPDGTDSYMMGVSALGGFGVAAGADAVDAAEADSLSESVETSTREALSSPAGAFVRALLSDVVAAQSDATKVPRLGEVLLLLRGVATTGPLERGLLATAGFIRVGSELLGMQLESLEMMRLDPYEQPVLAPKPELVECPSRSHVAEALSLVVRSCNVTAGDEGGGDAGAGVAAAGSPLASSPGELALVPQSFLQPAMHARSLANILYFHTAAGIPMVQHLCWCSMRLTDATMRFLDAELVALTKMTMDGAIDARVRPLVRAWAAVLSIQDSLTETRLHGMGGLERLVSTGTQLSRYYGRRDSVARALSYLSAALIEIACSGPLGRRAVLESQAEWKLWAKLG
ncbi:hypothetical protein FNF31_07835 [Cafeteria roenbergensis]|uniref:USP domain-containing protein n=1 Tax=Cafeteria roenbergensis TaxID=33653 RepID=A0A5A8BZL0_CAFRO|nr:hypothetical protein FNF31_07835 [Cafeteria roenbergensis]